MKQLPDAALSQVQDSAEPSFRYRMMREVIEAVAAPGTLFLPLLSLVTTFIDGLAAGPAGGSKEAYIKYLDRHFPDLATAIEPRVFYEKFRCGAVHDFSPKPGFGIGRGAGLGGEYVGRQLIDGREHLVLNIDRLVQDFLAHIRGLEANGATGR